MHLGLVSCYIHHSPGPDLPHLFVGTHYHPAMRTPNCILCILSYYHTITLLCAHLTVYSTYYVLPAIHILTLLCTHCTATAYCAHCKLCTPPTLFTFIPLYSILSYLYGIRYTAESLLACCCTPRPLSPYTLCKFQAELYPPALLTRYDKESIMHSAPPASCISHNLSTTISLL